MTDCFFFSAECMNGSSDIECLVNDSSVVFMQFFAVRWPSGSVDRQIWVVAVQ